MSFRDRLTWDAETGAYADGTIRYMMIRPDALMGILLNLPAALRPQVLEAMAASIHSAGGKSARSYAAADADALLATIAGTAPELGWGIWSFNRTASGLELTVVNSPFSEGYGAADGPVCAPIAGMLRAVGAMVQGAPVEASETACAACGSDTCRFTVRLAG